MHGLRVATPADLPAIVAIYNATIPSRMVTADLDPVTVADRRPWFDAHDQDRHPLWVLEEKQEITAWMSFQAFYGRPAYRATVEVSVYVAETHRGRGLGRTLLKHALSEARSRRIDTLLGFIFGHNEPSLRLFESLGFARWGRLPGVATLDGVQRDLVIVGRRVAE
jgi:L-amino acid N-acyltransferase YncA